MNFHDKNIDKFTYENGCLKIQLGIYTYSISKIKYLKVNGFSEGNIVFDISINNDLEIILKLVKGLDLDINNPKTLNHVKNLVDSGYQFFHLTSSYGAEVLAFAQEILLFKTEEVILKEETPEKD